MTKEDKQRGGKGSCYKCANVYERKRERRQMHLRERETMRRVKEENDALRETA